MLEKTYSSLEIKYLLSFRSQGKIFKIPLRPDTSGLIGMTCRKNVQGSRRIYTFRWNM